MLAHLVELLMAPLLTSVSSLSHNGDSDETDVIKAEPLTASSTNKVG